MIEALAVKQDKEDELLKLKGVTGVGVRNQRIIVYVETQEAMATLPLSLESIPVSGYFTGPIYALSVNPLSLQALAASRYERWRPAPGGVSLGHPLITAGTLGVLTRDGKILSNNHVIAASNQGMPGDPIWQPGKYDGGTEADKIAILEDYVDLNRTENYVDAAIGRPDSLDLVSQEILEVGVIYGWCEPQPGLWAEKSGRTTALTGNKTIDVHATLKVIGYPFGDAIFKEQVVIENPGSSFVRGGDSGSLVFTRIMGLPFAIGLVFAGSTTIAAANNIRYVIEKLRVELGMEASIVPPTGWELIGAFSPIVFPLGVMVSEESGKMLRGV